jgi:hypothetical protein
VAEQEHHAIRNGIIATVVGGILLSLLKPVRSAIVSALGWIWAQLLSIFSALQSSYPVRGWLLCTLILLSCIPVVWLAIFLFSKRKKTPEALYVEDRLFNVVWRWKWERGEPAGLWCFCPVCDMELVYDEHVQGDGIMRRDTRPTHTLFICERCNLERAKFDGLKNYAIGAVKREIRRRLRSGEWEHSPPRDAA